MAEQVSPGRLVAIDGSRGNDVRKAADALAARLRDRGMACAVSHWDASGLFGELAQGEGDAHHLAAHVDAPVRGGPGVPRPVGDRAGAPRGRHRDRGAVRGDRRGLWRGVRPRGRLAARRAPLRARPPTPGGSPRNASAATAGSASRTAGMPNTARACSRPQTNESSSVEARAGGDDGRARGLAHQGRPGSVGGWARGRREAPYWQPAGFAWPVVFATSHCT